MSGFSSNDFATVSDNDVVEWRKKNPRQFVPNIGEMNKFVVYATIIMIGVFNFISYFILFHNKGSHQEME